MRWVVLLLTAAACVGEDPARVTREIVSGTRDDADPAVVALTFRGNAVCSGTLVAPRVVLTAGHCVDRRVVGVLPTELRVFFGTDVGEGTSIPVQSGAYHPGWNPQPPYPNDIGVVVLAGVAPTAPVAMSESSFDPTFVGRTVRLVGFGMTAGTGGTYGEKREAPTTISDYAATTFSYGSSPGQTCVGDSGGPAFVTIGTAEVLAGVTSNGDDDCNVYGVDTRVDAYLDSFVRPFIDGAVGETPTGETCVVDGDCASGPCIDAPDDPRLRFCSQACVEDADCPAGRDGAPMRCVGTTAPGVELCVYDGPTPGAVGWPCSAADACFDGVCHDFEGTPICSRTCVAEGGADCPLGYSCQQADGQNLCLPADDAGGCGCRAGGRGALPLGALALLAALLLVRRRRPDV